MFFLLTYISFIFIFAIVYYLLSVYPIYKMYKQANLKNPWIAFIPGIGSLKLFNLANFSMWWHLFIFLIAFIPFIGPIVVLILNSYISAKIAKNFNLGLLGCVLAIFFNVFVFWYIALTNQWFVAKLNPKFTN